MLMANWRENVFDCYMVFAIWSIPLIGLLTWFHSVNMDALANDLEKAYRDSAKSPQAVVLDPNPKYDYRCEETVRVLSERGYTVSINGFFLQPESIEAKGICKVNPKVLRYWKVEGEG
ncbi:hypothetical protein [Pseudomonas amygdali]|uniref:Uncharacterized protein n=2 Tax=Pseudomonas amygdali TaxID=47877 RepID=A0AAD0V939_PSEAV|nr:hypothetical protein [Pseudomonas amygdali]AXH59692.1 hypothetical protein PLA107_031205 [Pseudomonas amygdali pv. lachrymans str. M301315]